MRKEFKITSKKNNQPIGFFDSGVGGLTVFAKLKELLPNEHYIYFGDTKHMPYGEKTENQLLEFSNDIFNFFETQNVKAVVMACNTTSSVVYDKVKDKYNFKIYPIIQSTAKILAEMPLNKIGVFATKQTVNSNAYKKEIQKYNNKMEVVQIACPKWVQIVEKNQIDEPQSILQVKEKLDEMMINNPEKIVLGCTHYPYLKNILKRFVPEDMLIDPAEAFAHHIKDNVETGDSTKVEVFVSSSPENFQAAAKMFYKLEEMPKLITLNTADSCLQQ